MAAIPVSPAELRLHEKREQGLARALSWHPAIRLTGDLFDLIISPILFFWGVTLIINIEKLRVIKALMPVTFVELILCPYHHFPPFIFVNSCSIYGLF